MTRKPAHSLARARPSGSGRQPQAEPGLSRSWLFAGLGLLGLAIAIGAFFVIKRQYSPRYWDDDDVGPIQVNKTEPPGPAPEGMVWVPGGTFWMGSDQFDDARPIHKVGVDGFWMDRTEVTNEQFARFVQATGYVTVTEQWPDPTKFKDFQAEVYGFQPEYIAHLAVAPGLPAPAAYSWIGVGSLRPLLKPCSLVFTAPRQEVDVQKASVGAWWRVVAWASWQHPEGPGSDLKGREKHPVVHICCDDAVAYGQWAGKRLPTEAEWEFASRGGLDRKRFPWGNDLMPEGKAMANTWQGEFPNHNTLEDGFAGTAPAASFPPNAFGLHDMAGNVWEWCSDWYQPRYLPHLPQRNPQGPRSSHDPTEPGVAKRVQRGGSFLCCDNYCMRYMVAGRGKGDPESTANHIGFRCVKSGN